MNRAAYRIVRELTHILSAVPLEALPYVARDLLKPTTCPARQCSK